MFDGRALLESTLRSQEFYERVARFYDLADKLYRWLEGKGDLLIVAATMTSGMIGTSVFSDRTEFSVYACCSAVRFATFVGECITPSRYTLSYRT